MKLLSIQTGHNATVGLMKKGKITAILSHDICERHEWVISAEELRFQNVSYRSHLHLRYFK